MMPDARVHFIHNGREVSLAADLYAFIQHDNHFEPLAAPFAELVEDALRAEGKRPRLDPAI